MPIYPRHVPTIIPRPPAHHFCKSPILPPWFSSLLHCHILHYRLFLLQDSLITELIPFTVLKQKEKQNSAHIKGFRIYVAFTKDLGGDGEGTSTLSPFSLVPSSTFSHRKLLPLYLTPRVFRVLPSNLSSLQGIIPK